jgi:uncharacterized protein (TIGR02145 family)
MKKKVSDQQLEILVNAGIRRLAFIGENFTFIDKSKFNTYKLSKMKKTRVFFFVAAMILGFAIATQAQGVSINTTGSSPNSSAMLDVSATNRGLLIPNIALTGTTDATTITTPAVSLLVYNTATVSTVTPGYYYNSGTTGSPVWTRVATGTIQAGSNPGDMLYWNGTAWVVLAATANEGAQLQMTGGVPTWVGGTPPPPNVTNPTTGKVWMDRNLGATQVATSSTDAAAYGDLYQWGRLTDGHQIRTSATTATLSSSDNPGHGNFILAISSPYDWRSPQNGNLWQGVSGTNNPCPGGYRLPTNAELDAERLSWSTNNSTGAYASPLKFTIAGGRSGYNGSLNAVGSTGFYWSSTVDGTASHNIYFDSGTAFMDSDNRVHGKSVRCIKN